MEKYDDPEAAAVSPSAIAGIVLGGTAFLFLVVGSLVYYYRFRKPRYDPGYDIYGQHRPTPLWIDKRPRFGTPTI